MEHRIRASAIVVKDNRLLLVKHQHPVTGFEWWVPPGGRLEDGETIYECAKLETYEETGLTVELGEIIYLREFIDLENARHNLEIFILASAFEGEPAITHLIPEDLDAAYIKEVRFLSQQEMKGLTVFPEILKDVFWQDLNSGRKPKFKYLGQQKG
ncbi:MAG TPA: NUDIX hydrolase [Dehalococcoidales bacterium]